MEKIHVLHDVCLIWEKWIKRQGPILLLLQVQVLNQRKLKNLLWDWFVQKEYHLCNTHEWMRKLQMKIHHRSSMWKQQEVQLLHWMNFRWKTSKNVANMKKWSTRESCVLTATFHRYITCSIPMSNQSTSKTSEVQIDMPRSSSSSRDAFSKILFLRQRQNEWSRHFQNYLKTARNQIKSSTCKSSAFSVAF